MSTEEFFAQEKAHTYVGVNVPKRLLMILGGPLVNIALAFLLVVGSLMFVGVPTAQNKAQLGSVELLFQVLIREIPFLPLTE